MSVQKGTGKARGHGLGSGRGSTCSDEVVVRHDFQLIVSANAGTRRPNLTWFLGCYVSRLLALLAAWCLCFLGGRKGRQEREERRSEEGRSGKKQGRKARKEGNIAPRMEPLGGSKMHPQKATKRSPKGSQIYAWRPLGGRWRPWGPLGGPRLIFE